jgi:hypothetical protein
LLIGLRYAVAFVVEHGEAILSFGEAELGGEAEGFGGLRKGVVAVALETELEMRLGFGGGRGVGRGVLTAAGEDAGARG